MRIRTAIFNFELLIISHFEVEFSERLQELQLNWVEQVFLFASNLFYISIPPVRIASVNEWIF